MAPPLRRPKSDDAYRRAASRRRDVVQTRRDARSSSISTNATYGFHQFDKWRELCAMRSTLLLATGLSFDAVMPICCKRYFWQR